MGDVVNGRSRTIVLLALTSLLLAGCPKGPSPGALNSAGSPSVGAGSASIGAGAGRGGLSAIGPTSIAAPSVRGATGTTLPALPSPTEFAASSALRDVQFEFDKYDIRPSEKAALDANVRRLKAHPRAQILIEGHCDERGTNEYNLSLGERRAQATRDYVASAGVTDSRITIVSYRELWGRAPALYGAHRGVLGAESPRSPSGKGVGNVARGRRARFVTPLIRTGCATGMMSLAPSVRGSPG